MTIIATRLLNPFSPLRKISGAGAEETGGADGPGKIEPGQAEEDANAAGTASLIDSSRPAHAKLEGERL